jgi:hypothetical protein
MPKNRRRKDSGAKDSADKFIAERTREVLEGQRQRFREKFDPTGVQTIHCSSIPMLLNRSLVGNEGKDRRS